MDAAGFPHQHLVGGQFPRSALDGGSADIVCGTRVVDARGVQIEQFDAFDTANTASGATGQRAALVLEHHERLLRDRQQYLGTVRPEHGFDVEDVGRALDNAFAECKAQRERFKVDGRGHHHRV